MSVSEQGECTLCQDTTVPLKGGGSVRWERQDTPELHYMATAPAMRRRQWAGEEKLDPLRDQITAIHQKGRVAWVDGAPGQAALQVAPLDVAPVLAETWAAKATVLTSATLPAAVAATVGLPAGKARYRWR